MAASAAVSDKSAATDPVPWMPGDTLFDQAALSALLHWDPVKYALNERIRDEGDEIVLWMPTVIREFIDKNKGAPEPTDLADYILDIMDAEFSMTIDDVEAVFLVKQLVQFHQDCSTGSVEALLEYMKKTTGLRLYDELYGRFGPRQGGGGSETAEGDLAKDVAALSLDAAAADSDMAEPAAEPEVDPDGWEVVTSKKKRDGRR